MTLEHSEFADMSTVRLVDLLGGAGKPASVREVQRAGKRATSAGLELLLQAKHDERELVKAIRDEGARR
eukprot:1271953-Prymnesium_polylepis.1